ncbi:DUF3325 domain-containing protein [Pseudochelatococcus sp. B33]
MSHVLCLLFASAGFLALSLAMTRHQNDMLGRRLPARFCLALRGSGFALLALAWAVAVRGQGFGIGTIVWCGHLTLAGLLVVALHTWHARRHVAPSHAGKGQAAAGNTRRRTREKTA